MLPRFEYGEPVRVIRNVRNDGTYPGIDTGTLLVRRGSVGYVRDVGTFLQDQIIYTVHFLDDDRYIGCREEELQPESDPWVPSLYETREKVTPRLPLGVQGEVIAKPGDEGYVLRVLRGEGDGVVYEVRFPGHTLHVPEQALERFASEQAPEDPDS